MRLRVANNRKGKEARDENKYTTGSIAGGHAAGGGAARAAGGGGTEADADRVRLAVSE